MFKNGLIIIPIVFIGMLILQAKKECNCVSKSELKKTEKEWVEKIGYYSEYADFKVEVRDLYGDIDTVEFTIPINSEMYIQDEHLWIYPVFGSKNNGRVVFRGVTRFKILETKLLYND